MPKSKSSEAAPMPQETQRPATVPTMTVEPTAGDSITIDPAVQPAAEKPEEPVHAEKP